VILPAPERVPMAPSMTPRKGEQTKLTKITLLVHGCEAELIMDPGWQNKGSRSGDKISGGTETRAHWGTAKLRSMAVSGSGDTHGRSAPKN
jgi:hypothetical protein